METTGLKPKPKVTRAVSRYFSELARRANAAMRGTAMAKERSAKALAARRRKRAERETVEVREI
jgi:hypothetical protein